MNEISKVGVARWMSRLNDGCKVIFSDLTAGNNHVADNAIGMPAVLLGKK